ncbi:DUF2975 domain-containing protein [Ferruginibacter sp.]
MKAGTKQILTVIHILAWVVFIGLCIKTGALLYSTFVSLFINEAAIHKLYMELNLADLYHFDKGYYILIMLLIIFLSALKAFIFYLVIKIFLKINLVHPFSKEVYKLITAISIVGLTIGLFAISASNYTDWLIKKGVHFPAMQEYVGGGSEFIFFAGIIFFIAQVFKRGMEIQTENELTV